MNRYAITDLKKHENAHHCMGCFGCFVKDPGRCVIDDEYRDQGGKIGHADELVIVSEMRYGGYSSGVKILLDRCLPYLHADFVVVNDEMHHKQRYYNNPVMKVFFYGENITDREKETAEKLVRGNCANYNLTEYELTFCRTAEEAIEASGLREEEF